MKQYGISEIITKTEAELDIVDNFIDNIVLRLSSMKEPHDFEVLMDEMVEVAKGLGNTLMNDDGTMKDIWYHKDAEKTVQHMIETMGTLTAYNETILNILTKIKEGKVDEL